MSDCNFKLNLPTDIPWERICVTEDMIDPVVCDEQAPAKWQTSMAVFKYKPEDEFQMYPKYNITYLKVTATITGYQPIDKEIQGQIDWDGVNVSTIPGLTDLLNAYNPCNGAILQVIVGPKDKSKWIEEIFEPKKENIPRNSELLEDGELNIGILKMTFIDLNNCNILTDGIEIYKDGLDIKFNRECYVELFFEGLEKYQNKIVFYKSDEELFTKKFTLTSGNLNVNYDSYNKLVDSIHIDSEKSIKLKKLVVRYKLESELNLKDYPFFLDFEPKKRELYELATDTKEKQSRSIESLNITKSSGSTQSMEVLDIDMGGGGFGASVGTEKEGAGFNYTEGKGQWGTKRINADESMSTRSSDVGQEKRESFSFSTQLSQMYHLLDSYHLGTNRILFFIQPRPHVLEEPSYFVDGPRQVEGIQEFFAIVAHKKELDDFCVSLRLDTSHMSKNPILDNEKKIDYTESALAVAPLPTKADTYVERKPLWEVDYGLFSDEIEYVHYTKTVINNVVYPVPDGYRIESYTSIINNTENGFSSVTISPDWRTLTIHAEATSSIWFKDEGSGACMNNCPPETRFEKVGRVERKLQINLISFEKTEIVDEEEVLLITTRGLCCCKQSQNTGEFVSSIKKLPDKLNKKKSLEELEKYMYGLNLNRNSDRNNTLEDYRLTKKYMIRRANDISKFVRTETIKSINDPFQLRQKYFETDFFSKQIKYVLLQSEYGRKVLKQSVKKVIPKDKIGDLEKFFKKKIDEISCYDILSKRANCLADLMKISVKDFSIFRMGTIGIKFKGKKLF